MAKTTRNPSEVFLELWRESTGYAEQSAEDFQKCAEAWEEIRAMERGTMLISSHYKADPWDIWPELVGHPDPAGEPGPPGVREDQLKATSSVACGDSFPSRGSQAGEHDERQVSDGG